ncbi:MAG: ABC transporter substrate-binding protein [Rhizobiaceae bacterium]|nr:ABC transporter substrate-binding protein [Rhizobiaceae bacterium]
MYNSMKNIKDQFLITLLVWVLFGSAIAVAEEKANQIVSIGGSVTEIIYALGEEDRLIARDTTSIYPPQSFKLPDVGYIRRLSPEGVLSVNPGMIITLEGAGPPEAVDVIKSSNVPFVEIKERYDREGVIAKIQAVGKALGVEKKAQDLVNQVNADFDTSEAIIGTVPTPKKVLFILSNNDGKILAAGTDTSAEGMIKMAGAENALVSMQGYKPVTDEAIIKAAPEVIVMMNRHGDQNTIDEDILTHPAIIGTPAGQSKSLIKMNGLYLLGYGPRTGQAALELSQKIYGE